VGLLISTTLAHAQTAVHYDFEDGQRRGHAVPMKVPPQMLTEGGNTFMRITGSTGDCSHMPSSLCPPRNRSTVAFTSVFSQMPVITSQNMRQTYRADLRFMGSTDSGVVFELFQGAPGGEGGYGNRNGTGPVVIFWRTRDGVEGRANYRNETAFSNFDLGTVRAGDWHTYMVKAVWSHEPSEGLIEIYFDGHVRMRVTGRDVNLGPDSNKIPEFKIGLYGDHATGIVDVDNVFAGPTGGAVPPPSSPPPSSPPPQALEPLPPPTQLRLVIR
jgi:hypothetical protein